MMTTPNHVTYIERDSVGQWGWNCTGCPEEASGFEGAAEVIESAEAHGPRAANSMVPSDDDEPEPCNYCGQPVIWDKAAQDYRHVDPTARCIRPGQRWLNEAIGGVVGIVMEVGKPWNYDNQQRPTVVLAKGLSGERMAVLVTGLIGPDAKWRLIRDENGQRIPEREAR